MEELFNDHGWKIIVESAELPDGRLKHIARVHRADSAHIIAFSKEGHILLLKEYRPFYQNYIWMLPSGRIDKEKDVYAGAMRELQEETGYAAKSLEKLWETKHTESMNMTNHIFIAKDLLHDPLPQDEDELIEVHDLLIEEALNDILASPEVHTPSAYALLRYQKEFL